MSDRAWNLVAVATCAAVFAGVLSVSVGWRPSNPFAPDFDGEWVLIDGMVDGEEIMGNTLIVDSALPGRVAIRGQALCNSFTGDDWDNLFRTAMACLANGSGGEDRGPSSPEPEPPPPGRWPEHAFMAAISEGPSLEGGLLIFEIDGVRLAYERVGDPPPLPE